MVSIFFQNFVMIELTSLLQSSQSTAPSFRAMKLSRLFAPPKVTFLIKVSSRTVLYWLKHDICCHVCPLCFSLSLSSNMAHIGHKGGNMRADRLLSIVLLLQTHRQLTSRSLSERLEVSERTIHRDMEALSYAGIPVVAERGSGGGWSLLGEYRTNLTGLNEAEIQSLFVSQPPKLLADLRLQKASEGALLKLLAALPTMYRRGAERARQRI